MAKHIRQNGMVCVFEDDEHYADEYIKRHYDECMKNFDLNISYFEQLKQVYIGKAETSILSIVNRVNGGINAEEDSNIRNLMLMSTIQTRELE